MKSNLLSILLLSILVSCDSADQTSDPKPNIIWIMAEDISNDLECYGMKGVKTPNLNKLSEEGVRYSNCFSTNPICSPNRSAMMVGVHQNMINAQHHRSNRDKPLMDPYMPITYWLRKEGYTCILGHKDVFGKGRKIDVNFKHEPLGSYDGKQNFGLFDKLDTIDVADQPFFAQIQLAVTHRGDWWMDIRDKSDHKVDTSDIELPSFMADHPVIKEDWARYLDQIEYMDYEIGLILQDLEDKDLADNTVVIFIGDNGRCNIRGKGYLHDSGLRVPLIIRWPNRIKAGKLSEEIISLTDISASILQLAGVELPDYLTGIPFIGGHSSREYVISSRDLWDEVMEKSRSVTTKKFKYIRNDKPEIPFDAHQAYLEFYRPALHIMRNLKDEGRLNDAQSIFFTKTKPEEELYDLKSDPEELTNLAGNPYYSEDLNRLRKILLDWEKQLPATTGEDFDFVYPVAVDVLEWVKHNKPELYQEMLEGKEIGFQKLLTEYQNR